ncbi:MAG: Eco57I restriction-modification methylase domain-containing protein [Ignavibacteriaceae bacterium]|nr:Eco57I restriction-modification methylase domain-containing protein [Ignavibacteriaceae bacterium]
MKEIENLIHQFNDYNLHSLLRAKTRTFRLVEEKLTQLNDVQFSESSLFGEFKVNNDDLIVVVTAKVNKPLSERSGKKAQYTLGKKFLKDAQKYIAGFFIFYDDKGDFRFSLIYDIPLSTGKRDWSNFRRFTYFVNKDQTNKTFIKQFTEADFTSLDKIIDAFSVEKVTKQFYQEIANWYFWAMDKVEFPDDEEKEREKRNAKSLIRLITRIIFIWFMKEKELVPSTLFEKSFIDKIIYYKDNTGSTYYKAILQNLFFATLNTKMKKDDKESRIFVEEAEKKGYLSDAYLQQGYYRYSRFIKDKNLFIEQFENVPFLNGGLFECLDKKIGTEVIRIDCFSDNPKNETKLKVPDEIFFLDKENDVDLSKYLDKGKNKKVTGLLTILKRYNFTIDENTPVDQDVALDPELLGKVFENLLAAYVPETSETARKATGSYYTPREIVEYMVNDSLIEHLKTSLNNNDKISEDNLRLLFDYASDENPFDEQTTIKLIEAIENIKILDPACGSGAFPMGILHKLVLALHKLDPDNKIWKKKLLERVPPEIKDETEKSLLNKSVDYIRKLGLIENCIYGVDIQEIAIQISKLRFFISLLVEQEIDDTKPNRDIRALPNLETKFVAANTLIGLSRPTQMSLTSSEIESLEKKLFEVREEIFYTNSRKEKVELQKKEKKLREQLKVALKQNGFQNDIAEKITSWDPFDQNTHSDWFDPEWMFGIKVSESSGFDIVIGNPPYISTKGVDSQDKKQLEQQYGFADDTYNHFYFKGINLLKENGILAYISSKTFWTIQTKKNLRELLLRNKILQLFDTANPFESAMVDTCVAIVQKQIVDESHNTIFLDGKTNLSNPDRYKSKQIVFSAAPNKVFFIPTTVNIKIYEKLGKTVNELLHKWWDLISTSKNIEKNKRKLDEYRKNLRPGDITLLGLITEGGQGLATANNGKYVGVLEETKWADNVKKQRPEKLLLATEFCKKQHIKTKQDAQTFLENLSEKEIRKLFDDLKEKYGRDVFGQGWLYRIVSKEEIADLDKLTEDEKLNGIKGTKTFVPYDKGDKDGNRWYAPTPYYIDWSRENVKFLKENSGKKGEGMPVVRNPQFYFREGFCWSDIHTLNIKCRIKINGIHDVKSMSLFSLDYNEYPEYYFVCLLNSTFVSEYVFSFIKNTQTFQINDARLLPIIIPTPDQLKQFENIFERAYNNQKQKFEGKIKEIEAENNLSEIQKELDEMVEEMYMGKK